MVDDPPEPMKFGAPEDAPVLAVFARVRAPGLPPGLEARVEAAVAAPPPSDPLARLFFAHGDEAWSFLLAATGATDVARAALEDALFRVHRRLTHRKHAGDELDGPALDGAPGQALVLGCARESAADAWDVLKKNGREPPAEPQAVGDVTPRVCPGAPELLARVLERAEKERAHLKGVKDLSVKIALACTYCHAALSRGDAVYCASCLAPHHDECFREHGRCTAPGCGERLVVRAGVPAPYHRPRRRRPFIIGFGLVAALSGAALLGTAAVRLGPSKVTEAPSDEALLRAARDEAWARAAKIEAEAAQVKEKLAYVERESRTRHEQLGEAITRLEVEKLRAQIAQEQLGEADGALSERYARDIQAKQREIDDLRSQKSELQDRTIELARRFDSEKQRLQQEKEALARAVVSKERLPAEMWATIAELARDRAYVTPARAKTNGEFELAAMFGELETRAGEGDLMQLVVLVDAARKTLERARGQLSTDELREWTSRLEALEAALVELERRELLTTGISDLQALETATQEQDWEEAEACAERLERRLAHIARSKSDEARAAGKDLARLVGPAARGMRAEKALAGVAARVGRIERRADGVAVVFVDAAELEARDPVPGTKPEVIVVSIDAAQGQALFAAESRKRLVSARPR